MATTDQALPQEGRTLSVTLGIKDYSTPASATPMDSQIEEELTATEYEIRPDPESEKADLSKIRGQTINNENKMPVEDDAETELAALAELLPEVTKRLPQGSNNDLNFNAEEGGGAENDVAPPEDGPSSPVPAKKPSPETQEELGDNDSSTAVNKVATQEVAERLNQQASMNVNGSGEGAGSRPDNGNHGVEDGGHNYESNEVSNDAAGDATSFDDYPESENALNDDAPAAEEEVPKEFLNSGQSISTATQTHEVRMPMYLPTFKPATGCTNASDFIVRCFVARLRSGITVVKHGRSRWCKSRLRVLQIHPDGRSLTWKPAEGEPTTNRKPPKLDLSTCLEVRHAWSPDPHNPMYTGTPILRQKCEAANAHKSFALIFKHRTVDITAVTADQCKVLMEGFSALCFRLQVASLAGRSGTKNKSARPMPDEDGVSVTASNTLTNNSATKK